MEGRTSVGASAQVALNTEVLDTTLELGNLWEFMLN